MASAIGAMVDIPTGLHPGYTGMDLNFNCYRDVWAGNGGIEAGKVVEN
jgi:hypothetical protein